MTDLRTPPVDDGDLFSDYTRRYFDERHMAHLRVLEAGCGTGRGLRLDGIDHHVTGIDADTPELRARTLARDDLHIWHLGDLRTVPLPPRSFDVVHASHLLERTPHAELVLDRFVAALKPGGLLLVRFRDRSCALGLLDRLTPGRLRAPLWRMSPAGHGAAPPAVYDPVASTSGMHWYCVIRGLMVAEEYASRASIEAFGRYSVLVGGLCRVLAAGTRGRVAAGHSDVTMIVRKPENRLARVI